MDKTSKSKGNIKKNEFSPKLVIGMTENVTIFGKKKELKLVGRIDTGAAKSSIHSDIVKDLDLGPVLSVKQVKNANGISLRPVIEAQISIHNKKIKSLFTVTDRSHMNYQILIGRNVLNQGFLIDPSLSDE